MKPKNMNTNDLFSEKIIAGIKKAVNKMIALRAKLDEDIVIIDENGKPYRVKAKDFLAKK